ncbi:hypothetical protein F4776DRAFT_3174 [Hypoxylon sp. NC0597]|nr:hypothetical protein F4776DRAFT_3174 [Hypoxylon sp. NC0597]
MGPSLLHIYILQDALGFLCRAADILLKGRGANRGVSTPSFGDKCIQYKLVEIYIKIIYSFLVWLSWWRLRGTDHGSISPARHIKPGESTV